jgi:hypothetical protein
MGAMMGVMEPDGRDAQYEARTVPVPEHYR